MGFLNKIVNKPEEILAIIQTARDLARNKDQGKELQGNQQVLEALMDGAMGVEGLMPWSSNYTFLVTLDSSVEPDPLLAIYKPCQGERPLWDFPGGSLCRREFVSFLVSQVLGWPRIPPTVLRDGPHGQGSVQLFIDAEYEAHYFNMRNIPAFVEEFKRMALFDYIVNNADRKGGHCLKDKDGQLWAIDHGLTFHTDFKLRTVIWEFCEETIPTPMLEDLECLQAALASSDFFLIISSYIDRREAHAFKNRVTRLLTTGCFPEMHPGRNVPFPPI